MSSSSSSSGDAVPQQLLGIRLSTLCSLLPRWTLLTGIYRNILTQHFADAGQIEDPDLRHLLWMEQERSGILIESNHRWRPELTEKRPAIIVRRNSFQNHRRGIGDTKQGPAVDMYGHTHYATFWIGSHTLFCCGGSGQQAELLGGEVQRELTQFGPEIRRKLYLLRIQVSEVGPIVELEEAQENYAVPVTVACGYEERWIIRKQVPRLNHISLSLLTSG